MGEENSAGSSGGGEGGESEDIDLLVYVVIGGFAVLTFCVCFWGILWWSNRGRARATAQNGTPNGQPEITLDKSMVVGSMNLSSPTLDKSVVLLPGMETEQTHVDYVVSPTPYDD